ncbi:MAG: spore protease YyaC [Firmicutes bacterium HGW-Firmicutes-7]|nr:MAG: spore protease YyaC [Firmicutes bacterium HGW-Firmicutes-7]
MKLAQATKNIYFNTKDKTAMHQFTKELTLLIKLKNPNHRPIVVLCIGTDRATGDCLGPIIGYKLKAFYLENIIVYGTLSEPIHAKNIEDTLLRINKMHSNALIIAIDACLGKTNHIGMVNLGEGSLTPGSGVNKVLPPVGDIYITGIVNFSGFMDMMVLQNTRLNTVMEMADFIVIGLKRAFTNYKYFAS